MICPHCGSANDMHTREWGRLPEGGDVSLCWTCRRPSVYEARGSGLTLRFPTLVELDEIECDPEFRAALAVISRAGSPRQALESQWWV